MSSTNGFLVIMLLMSYLKTARLMRQFQRDKRACCLRSALCLKTRLKINVSKPKAFHGKMRHLSAE